MSASWLLALALFAASSDAAETKLLDNFETIDAWSSVASDEVKASLRQADGVAGKAMCLDYDFNGVSGYAVARRKLPMDYPANYEYAI
ncbi:MAG: hypothetical protein WC213_05110, partial [Arenimonas sp.]